MYIITNSPKNAEINYVCNFSDVDFLKFIFVRFFSIVNFSFQFKTKKMHRLERGYDRSSSRRREKNLWLMQSKRQITLVRSTCFKTLQEDSLSFDHESWQSFKNVFGHFWPCGVEGRVKWTVRNRWGFAHKSLSRRFRMQKRKKYILSRLHTGSSVFLDTFCSYETTQFCFKENRNCVSVKKHYKYEISGRSQKCFQKTKLCKLSVIKIIIIRNLSMHRQFSQMFSPEMLLLNM